MSLPFDAISLRKFSAVFALTLIGGILLLFDPWGLPWRHVGRRLEESELPVLLPLNTTNDKEAPYRPIFMLHGLGADHYAWTNMIYFIGREHPGTVVFPIPMFEKRPDSLAPLEHQVKKIAEFIRMAIGYHPVLFSKGYHLLCHSQGALTCRAVVQAMDDHRVRTLVSLAGPQMGVYGPDLMQVIANVPLLSSFNYKTIYHVAYASLAQATLSMANLWNDPLHQVQFLRENTFLTKYNGLSTDVDGNFRRKANFVRLEKAVFLVGTVNGPASSQWGAFQVTGLAGTEYGIEPAISGVWGYFKKGDVSQLEPMEHQDIYKQDLIGLKTLHQTDRLVNEIVEGVDHSRWLNDEDLVRKYIIPHLV